MKATRLLSLPPYLFEDLENRYREALGSGRDVIDLSVGDPDLPPPESLLGALKDAIERAEHHRYPPQRGTDRLKASIKRYLLRRGGAGFEDDEILVLIGSKEGLGHLPLAVCNPGDLALIPDPGYPVYGAAATFAGCDLRALTLEESNGFLPDFASLSDAELAAATLCFLNYPNNPTGALADGRIFGDALRLGTAHEIVIANDAAYADVYYGDEPPPLLCAQPGAAEAPMIEFFSFSKTFSITGWRVGFAVGRRDVIEALAHIKANLDSGVFGAIQEALSVTLDADGDDYARAMREEFKKRRDRTFELVGKLGFQTFPTCATFYVWARVPDPFLTSMDFVLHVLERADVLVTPGAGFGRGGEGYFRIALTQSVEKIEEALHRMGRL